MTRTVNRPASRGAGEPPAAKLILALDVDRFERAKYFINLLYPRIKIFKVGSQLFTGCGPKIAKYLHKKGAEVFLDLKFYDIPNTVANALRQAVRLKVKMLTLHLSAGKEMLKAAVSAAKDEALKRKLKPPLLIGVTILTSQKARGKEILDLARLGLECGLDGLVCSSREVKLLRQKLKGRFIIITPGIRPKGAGPDDQKRTATAKGAIKSGSDYLVVGRPILESKDPIKAIDEIMGPD